MTSEIVLKVVMFVVAAILTFILARASKALLTESERKMLQEVIATAVAAAEQTYKEPKSGELKKMHVLGALYEKGLLNGSMTESVTQEIDDMIEAAVYALNHKES